MSRIWLACRVLMLCQKIDVWTSTAAMCLNRDCIKQSYNSTGIQNMVYMKTKIFGFECRGFGWHAEC